MAIAVSRAADRPAGGSAGAGGRIPVSAAGGRAGSLSVRPDGVDLMRGGVFEIQRARILAALVEVCRERGAGRVTVAHIVERSGVSRRTFYEMFDDRDACFLAAFHEAVRRACASVLPAYRCMSSDGGGGRGQGADDRVWCERVRAGLLALLAFLDEEPGLGGLCVVDALGAGPAALQARARVVGMLVDAVDDGRAEAEAGLSPSRLTAEGVVGGVLAVLYSRLSGRLSSTAPSNGPAVPVRTKPLVGLLNPLMGTIVLPYLGPAAAARETTRRAPRARRRSLPVKSNPLEGLEMRLTYRTVQVLAAIAARPGSSNRQVADAAGVIDQGQISKLLARLEHVGLVSNNGLGSSRGEPNAWRLTPRGQEIQRTIHEQTAPTGV
jgi:AcrR family transcriptional regulator/DNA-binding MarR family transcriptional regulator